MLMVGDRDVEHRETMPTGETHLTHQRNTIMYASTIGVNAELCSCQGVVRRVHHVDAH